MLTLGNLIDFNELELKYNKRVKLRFNTDWKSKETRVGHCFRMMYFDDERLLNNWMNSTYSEKTTRQNNNEIVMQFIEILPHRWLFVDAVNVIKKKDLVLPIHSSLKFIMICGPQKLNQSVN